LCAQAGIVVISYEDNAEGFMIEEANGAGQFTSIILKPKVTLAPDANAAAAENLHHKAHEMCFIARSLNFPIEVNPITNLSWVRSGSFASNLVCPRHVRLGGNLGNAGCPVLPVEGIGLDVIQAPKPERWIMRYELTDFECAAIKSFLPNKLRGIPRVSDRWSCHRPRRDMTPDVLPDGQFDLPDGQIT
jgi:hypothetical protein